MIIIQSKYEKKREKKKMKTAAFRISTRDNGNFDRYEEYRIFDVLVHRDEQWN